MARIVAKAVLLGGEAACKFLQPARKDDLTRTQTKIAQDGPGKPLLYRAMNGSIARSENATQRGIAALSQAGALRQCLREQFFALEIKSERRRQLWRRISDAIRRFPTWRTWSPICLPA